MELLKNKINFDMSERLRQKVINKLIANNIGTYYEKDQEKGQVLLRGISSKKQRILSCLDSNIKTIKYIDEVELEKGYKYMEIFSIENIDIPLLKQKAITYEKEYFNNISDENYTLYKENEKAIIIKFNKTIDLLEKNDTPKWYKVRFPVIAYIDKETNILCLMFDRINTDKEIGYYKNCIDSILSWLVKNARLSYKILNTDQLFRDLLNDNQKICSDLTWTGELENSKVVTIKAGEDMKMPFFEQIHDKIDALINEITTEKYTQDFYNGKLEGLNQIKEYTNNLKEFADDRLRTIRLLKKLSQGAYVELDEKIDFKITFNYSSTMKDLIEIYDLEKNDMERIENVIKIIGFAKMHN